MLGTSTVYMRMTALLLSLRLDVMRPAAQPLLHVAMAGAFLPEPSLELCVFFSSSRSFLSFRSHLWLHIQVCQGCRSTRTLQLMSSASWVNVKLK